jgi:hypothetical protein
VTGTLSTIGRFELPITLADSSTVAVFFKGYPMQLPHVPGSRTVVLPTRF